MTEAELFVLRRLDASYRRVQFWRDQNREALVSLRQKGFAEIFSDTAHSEDIFLGEITEAGRRSLDKVDP